ncbi:MAG: xylulokinase, partial [Armatimonadetes bacterium]|nr:xylulokinase [Anaerolineae bacterium]
LFMALLLAIDIGTSSAKALLFESDSAQVLAVATEEYPLLQSAPNHAEQNPSDWWLSTISVVVQCLEAAGRRDVAAIGLTGQMHGVTLLDEHYQVLRPSIIWADSRSGEISRALTERFGAARYAAVAGTLPAAGFMGPSLMWLAQHEPELLQRVRMVLLPKDYVRLKLTGSAATDYSDAAATGIFDVTHGAWSTELLDAINLPLRIFPPVVASTAIAGRLTTLAGEALGLQAGIAVVTGCADQPAQALANGLIAPGMASVTTGTGGQVCVPLRLTPGQPVPTDPRVHVFNHAVPGMHYVLGAILAGGLCLRWLRDLTGLRHEPSAYALLSAEAAQTPPGASGLLFLPYLMGERTPHMDAAARGAFIGLRYHHGRGHMARAVMEGVAFALRQTLDISVGLAGIQPTELIGAGGALESVVWRGIQTDVFGLPIKKTLLREQTCIGAALLAGVGIGAYTDLAEASAAVARFDTPTLPDTVQHAAYNDAYAHFVALYPRLRDDFAWLSSRPGLSP